MRSVLIGVAAALGLILASILAPGGAHGPVSAVAQENAADDEGEETPTTDEKPGTGDSGEPKPSDSGAPAPKPSSTGGPAFSPSSSGSTPSKPTGAPEEAEDDGLAAPAVSGGVYSDPLSAATVFESGVCPTGLAGGQYVGEGFALIVQGRCVSSQDSANVAVTGRGITLGDGDLALDVKVAEGAERAGVNLYIRNRDAKLMAAYLDFGSGQIELFKREAGTNTIVSSRGGLRELVNAGDWNRVALRAQGAEIWLLLNDEPVLHAADVFDQVGGVGVGVVRTGNPDDDGQVVVVFRDLTLSTVEGSPGERIPTYTAP